jgi:hypothetical protein
VNLQFSEALSQSTPCEMFNSLNIVFEEDVIPSGTRLKTFVTRDYAPGMYFIKVDTYEGFVIKKIMINHQK